MPDELPGKQICLQRLWGWRVRQGALPLQEPRNPLCEEGALQGPWRYVCWRGVCVCVCPQVCPRETEKDHTLEGPREAEWKPFSSSSEVIFPNSHKRHSGQFLEFESGPQEGGGGPMPIHRSRRPCCHPRRPKPQVVGRDWDPGRAPTGPLDLSPRWHATPNVCASSCPATYGDTG